MAGTRLEYQIVGRYMDGKEVTGYHLQCLSNSKSARYTKDQVCFLVGRGQVTNCSGQLYQDKVLLRGVGMSLEDLPVQQEDGRLSRTDSVGKVRRGATAADVMTQLMLSKAIVSGRNVIGYVVTNAGGGTNNASRAQILELAKNGRIGNARYQESNGKPILRGVNINLNELPTVTAEELGLTPAKPKATTVPATTSHGTPAPATTAPATTATATTATALEGLTDSQKKLKESDIELVVKFKKACKNTFRLVNKRLNNALCQERFSDSLLIEDYNDNIPDTVLEKFEFGTKNRPDDHGGWIDLVIRDNGAREIEFFMLNSYSDILSKKLEFSEDSFKEGWNWLASQMKYRRML